MFPAFSLSKVGHWNKLSHNGPTPVEKSLHSVHRLSSCLLLNVLDPYISDHMVSNVVSDDQIFDLAVLGKLNEDFFVEFFEVLNRSDQFTLFNFQPIGFPNGGGRILVQVLEDHRLGQRRFIVQTSACVPVAAGSNLEVEGAINFIFLSSEYFCKPFSHFCVSSSFLNYNLKSATKSTRNIQTQTLLFIYTNVKQCFQ